ncbi:MAG: hypothetical protein L3K19_06680 [Thermoplasmata archaeon]|nr:hypothetical protein [Thermoplasmata archaeon]
MQSERAQVPESVREWFTMRHPDCRIEFQDVWSSVGLDMETLSRCRTVYGWFTISPPADRPAPGGPVRFFRAQTDLYGGGVISASEHRPTPPT